MSIDDHYEEEDPFCYELRPRKRRMPDIDTEEGEEE